MTSVWNESLENHSNKHRYDQETLIQDPVHSHIQAFLERWKKNRAKKDQALLQHARVKRLMRQAKKLGISTEKRTFTQLRNQICHKHLYQKAQNAGIETNGKSKNEISHRLYALHLETEAQKVGISPENLDFLTLSKLVRQQMILQEASELRISVDEKPLETLEEEIRFQKIKRAASLLDINVENKNERELLKEIVRKHPHKLKELDLFPRSCARVFFPYHE
jgi:hypothetical protein